MKNITAILISSIIVYFLAAFLLKFFPQQDGEELVGLDESDLPQEQPVPRSFFDIPPVRDGVIVINKAGKSAGIFEVSKELTKHGYHLMIGSPTDNDKAILEGRKGIEFINFDMFDPSTFPDLIYRLRIIERDLQRPLAGLVINLCDYLDSVENAAVDVLDMKSIENVSKHSFSSPSKVVLALFELLKHQSLNSRDDRDEVDDKTPDTSLQGNGFRIILIAKYYSPENCNLHCVFQKTLINYLQLLTNSNIVNDFSVSIVPLVIKSTSTSAAPRAAVPMIPWVLDLSEDDNEPDETKPTPEGDSNPNKEEIQFESATKSLLHAITSHHPLKEYPVSLSPLASFPSQKKTPKPRKNTQMKMKSGDRSQSAAGFNPYERYKRPKRNTGRGNTRSSRRRQQASTASRWSHTQ